MDTFLKKTYSGFEPAPGFEDDFDNYKYGDLIRAKLFKVRNPLFHSKYFALLKLAFQNQYEFDDFNDFREALLVNAGFWVWYKKYDGTMDKRAKSISFSKMDEGEFQGVFNKLVDQAMNMIANGDFTNEDRDNLISEIINFI